MAGRVAEVIVTLPGGERRRGSGYRVATGAVLTAAHVVAGADTVRVRFDAARPGERTVGAAVAWQHADTDTAVLTVDCPDAVEDASFGRIGERAAVLSCTAVGFPRFKMRTGDGGARYRDSEHVHGTCAVLSNRKEGTLDLNVTPPADATRTRESPWEGMSGAVVFSAGRIVGVVSRHHLADGPGRLAAGRVDRWAERLSAAELRELEGLLGSRLAPDRLPDVEAPTTMHGAGTSPYGARLLDLVPAVLEDRDDELRLLAGFCAGGDPYAWVQAPPWAGKTALAAWCALHPPQGVVPVWFFVTARLAGQADHAAFTESLTHQLAAVAGRAPARHASAAGRDGEWRLLLREAAEHLAPDGRTLLLIVDGLDEDRSASVGGPSIAALLPEQPPPNVRVLVTSRPCPGLPADLPGTHPLRSCDPIHLRAVDAARHTEHEAVYELSAVLAGDDLGRDLVGLLAAARSELTLPDLHELTGCRHAVLKQRLAGGFARILRQRTSGPDPRGHLFAHETMLAAALRELGPDMTAYRERIHAWARRYADAGWLPGTPAYLLQPYGRMVAALGEPDRGPALATDPRRHDRMRAHSHSDTDALAEIDAFTAVVARSAPEALGRLAALAAARHLLTERSAVIPPKTAVALAALGHSDRAVATAYGLTEPVYRAEALAGVARVLADRGDPRAADMARLAVRLADAEDTDPDGTFDTPRTLLTAATALMVTGHEEDALHALDSCEGWVSVSPAEALAELAVAAHPRDAALSAKLLGEAVTRLRAYEGAEKVAGLADIARTCATVDAKLSKSLYRRIMRAAGEAKKYDDTGVLAAAAEALRDVRPEQAADLADHAVRAGRGRLDGIGRTVEDLADLVCDGELYGMCQPYERTVEAVAALLAADMVEDAERALESWRWDLWGAAPTFFGEWSDIAMGWARQGRADEAWSALAASWNPIVRDPDGTAEMVTALARAGASARAESLARTAAVSLPWVAAEALAALATHHAARDPEHAERLLAEAEDLADGGLRGAAGAARSAYSSDHLAALAVALAVTGRYGDAERAARLVAHEATRAWALAGLSLAHAEEGSPHAPRLAHEAAGILRDIAADDLPALLRAHAPDGDREAGPGDASGVLEVFATLRLPDYPQVSAVVQALGCVGATARAEELIALHPDWSAQLRLAEATGLWHYVPGAARDLVASAEARPAGGHAGADGPVADYARVLLAVGHQDPARSARLGRAAEQAAGRGGATDRAPRRRPQDLLIAGLLSVAADPEAARRHLAAAREIIDAPYHDSLRWSRSHLVAVLHAALGDYRSAVASVRDVESWTGRAGPLTELAAYIAGARGLPTTADAGDCDAPLTLIRRLAAFVAPPELADGGEGRTADGPRLITPATRRSVADALLAEVLTTPDWHKALPVIADLDPGGIGLVRDVVFAHLGLDEEVSTP